MYNKLQYEDPKAVKARRKSADLLKNPDLKVLGCKTPTFFIVFKAFGFVINPVIFGTRFVPLCVNAKTYPVLIT